VLLTDALDPTERAELKKAIDWIERSRAALREGKATLEEVDASQPFGVGSEAWFYYVLLMNKPCQTLHGPYTPLIVRGTSARDQAEMDGLVCGTCHCAGGKNTTVKLRRCGHCQLISYCSRDCQALHYKEHKRPCKAQQKRRAEVKSAQKRAGRLVLQNRGDDPPIYDMDDPEKKASRALLARHLRDGYGESSLILYEDIGQLNNPKLRLEDEPFWAIVTLPVKDPELRKSLLGRHEAVFNTAQYANEYDALVRWSVITPLLDKVFVLDDNNRSIELPIARIDIDQIPPETLWDRPDLDPFAPDDKEDIIID